jgi:peroxiredoxin
VVARTLPGLLVSLLLGVAAPLAAEPAAPGFTVRLLGSQRPFDSRDLIGKKVLVLRFQASWCKPCAKESAALTRVAERYRARGVEVLAVHVQDTAADARRFVRERKVTYPIALDPRLTIANHFGFKGTPYTVVVDRRGEMVARIHGESAVRRLPRLLDGLVHSEGASTAPSEASPKDEIARAKPALERR